MGLGNPGLEYRHTRHNLGFRAVDEFCRRQGLDLRKHQCRSRIARGWLGSHEILVAQPETYMNASGEAVACLLEQYEAAPPDLLVICDDVALPLGTLRIRPSGRDGGHRGLRSLVESLGTEAFPRLKIGIGTPPSGRGGLTEHVLAAFGPAEKTQAEEQIRRAAECIRVALEEGIQTAMNRFNRRQAGASRNPPVAS